jgi:hypothetical protein
MIRHVVVMTWKPEATEEQKQEVSAALATLPPLLKGLLNYSFGHDAALADGNASFAVVADFEDTESYLAYRTHPAHLDVINRVITPISLQRRAVQFEC